MSLFDADNWYEVMSTLKKNKWRTFFTAFGVFWGIFMLVIMLGSGRGLQTGTMKGFSGFATNSFFLWTEGTTKPYMGLPVGRSFEFNNEDVLAIKNQVPEVECIAPRNQLGGYRGSNTVVYKTKTGSFSVNGDTPDIFSMLNLDLMHGRFMNWNDINEKRKVCMVGSRVLEILFPKNTNPVGEYIRINGVYFQVIGSFRPNRSGERGIQEMETIFIPLTSFQQAFNYGNDIGWMAITSKPGFGAEDVENKVKTLLKQRHKVAPDDKKAIGGWNLQKQFQKMTGVFTGINWLIWIVGTGTLFAGVVGVSNIMLIIVKERTRELGIRRALGATPLSIITQILLESAVLTTFAGYLGLVTGVALLEGIAAMIEKAPDSGMFSNPTIDLGIGIIALVVLIISGLLAGLIPARRAIKIPPVEALRTE